MSHGAVVDPVRLDVVRRSGLVDSGPEFVFDELTNAAARLLDAPFAFLTAVDDKRSFWKSSVGITDGTRSSKVEDSFCQYVIELGDELIVGDTPNHHITRHNPFIDSMGIRAWAGCPVVVGDQVVGTFCVVDQHVRHWTDDDRALLRHLAAVASREVTQRVNADSDARDYAEAIARADKSEDLLEALRASLLPQQTPDVPGVDFACWYQPAHDGHLLLGDFYDAFPVDHDRWAIVIADVCGHGAKAARLTAMIRYTLRSALVHNEQLTDAIAELDQAIRADPLDDGRFATLCIFRITVGDDHLDVDYARAGHPFPFLVTPPAQPRLLDGPGGLPVGLPSGIDAVWTTETIRLTGHDSIVAYTDGATECLGPDGTMIGHEGLLAHLADLERPISSADLVTKLRHHITSGSTDLSDDVLVLAFAPDPPNRRASS